MALKSRIKLRYDTYNQWAASDPVLLAGELAVVALTDESDTMNDQPDTILFKIGDGKTKFSELGWTSSLAADVYDWAKAASRPVYSYGDSDLTGFGTAATHNIEASITNSENIPTSAAIISYIAAQLLSIKAGQVITKKMNFDSDSEKISTFLLPKGANIKKVEFHVVGSTSSSNPSSATSLISLKSGSTVEKVLISTDDLDFNTIKNTSYLPETFIYDALNYSITSVNGVNVSIDVTSLKNLSGTLYLTYNLE